MKSLRHELTWIVAKAMDKERNRRYASPSGLADDVRSYLADEAVAAGPLSLGYRLKKQVRRHRAPLAIVVTLTVILVISTSVSTYFAVKARRSENELRGALAKQKDQLVVQGYDRALAGDVAGTVEIIEQLKLIDDADVVESRLRGVASFYGGDQTEAIKDFNEVLDSEPDDLISLAMLSIIHGYNGDHHASEGFTGRVNQLDAETDIERLFKAYVILYGDYAAAEAILTGLLEKRPSWTIARVFTRCHTLSPGVRGTRERRPTPASPTWA